MKALDTSVLLALLEGDAAPRELVKRLRGVELATTEANLLELHYLAGRGPARSRAGRRAVVERLRQKLTVLPIDGRATEQASHRLGKGSERTAPQVLAMLGALEANGCDELYTQDPSLDPGKWRFKISRIGHYSRK